MYRECLVTACVLSTIGLNAFGAPSVRAGSLTVPTKSNTADVARAASVSTGALTKGAVSTSSKSATESVDTNTTSGVPLGSNGESEARLAFFQKGLTSKTQMNQKSKDVEINAIQSRIDQLEEKQVEKTDVYEKTEVYNKDEMNELLRSLISTDTNGNISISDSNGATIAQFLPYSLYATHKYNSLANTQTYKLRAPHDFKTSSFGSAAQEYTRNWVADICAPEQSNPDLVACGFGGASGKDTAMTEFNVISCFKGMNRVSSSLKDNMVSAQYTTFEDLNESQINNRFCSGASSDECSISGYTKNTMGACAEKTFTLTESVERAMLQNPYIVAMKCPEGCHMECDTTSNDGSSSVVGATVCRCLDNKDKTLICEMEYMLVAETNEE